MSNLEWYRIINFILFIDHFIRKLNTKFINKFKSIILLEGLILANKNKYNTKEIFKSLLIYISNLSVNFDHEIKVEIKRELINYVCLLNLL